METWRKRFRELHTIDYLQKKDQEACDILIARFKEKNLALMKLDPEVGIRHVSQDDDGNPLNIFFLALGHPFIFDYRLIPASFESIEVKNELCEDMPKEFPESVWVYMYIHFDVYYSPERYRQYVERNIDLIKVKLKSKNMSINEALDALTGGFERYVERLNTIKNQRAMEHKYHIEFFNTLLKKTKTAFYESDVYKNHRGENWGYSVTATSFEKNEMVIVGFNWGVDNEFIKQGNSYGAQSKYPMKNFASNYEELGSFKRTLRYFHRYFESLPQVQTNYCFFRSVTESQITPKDLVLCEELFDSLIEYLEPKMLISFSRSLNTSLKEKGGFEWEDQLIQSGNKQISVTKGTIEIAGKRIPYFNLPHPNYPIRGEARESAWKYCFGEPKY